MATRPRATPARFQLPPRKPMAQVRRVSLFEREVRVSLSSIALDILFQLATHLSEGAPAQERGGYFGSTMVTIDLQRAAPLVSDPCDAATMRRLAELIATDSRVRERARALAAAEAGRLAGEPLAGAQFDLRVRTSGHNLHIDVDVEARGASHASDGRNRS
jgi:hypothetical protein